MSPYYFLTTTKILSREELKELGQRIELDDGKLEAVYVKDIPLRDGTLPRMGLELIISGYPSFEWIKQYNFPNRNITTGKRIDYESILSNR